MTSTAASNNSMQLTTLRAAADAGRWRAARIAMTRGVLRGSAPPRISAATGVRFPPPAMSLHGEPRRFVDVAFPPSSTSQRWVGDGALG